MSDRTTEPTQPERPPHVLAVDDDDDIRHLVATYLTLEGFEVSEARDGRQAVELAIGMRPDLILMDIMMPGMSGTEALVELRKDFRTAYIPVVFLTAKSLVSDKVEHLISGADDYIVKPFDPDELVARVRVVLRRSRAMKGLNPITGLPGNNVIEEEITGRLRDDRAFACLYVDLAKFKEYNDYYGFSRGDEVIAALATIMLDVLVSSPSPEHFIGHVGGDDFIIVTSVDLAVDVAQQVVERFDAVIPTLYDDEDRDRGWIEIADRRGDVRQFPFVAVSVGIVTSDTRPFASYADVSQAAAHMKGVAKQQTGSAWMIDRRRI